MTETLEYLRASIMDNFPDLVNDPQSLQYEWVKAIDQALDNPDSYVKCVECQHTGGNIYNDVITLKDGIIVRISEGVIGVYMDQEADDSNICAKDVFISTFDEWKAALVESLQMDSDTELTDVQAIEIVESRDLIERWREGFEPAYVAAEIISERC